MPSRIALLFAASAATACSLVYDTEKLREGAGGDLGGAAGTTANTTSMGAAGSGGEGGESCHCPARADLVWLVEEPSASPSQAPPICPADAVALEAGGLAGTLVDEGSACGGPCVGPSRVKIAVDDGCGVGGDGLSNDGTCDARVLIAARPGDTSLAINLEPLPCALPDPELQDTATVTLASACPVSGDACAPPIPARVCVPTIAGRCADPCFAEHLSVQSIVDSRDCAGVPATCSPAVVGELSRFDDDDCALPVATWQVTGAPICPADPPPPLSPATTYWRYTAMNQPCDAFALANGSVTLDDLLIELCCAAR